MMRTTKRRVGTAALAAFMSVLLTAAAPAQQDPVPGQTEARAPFTATDVEAARPHGLPSAVRFDADSADAYEAFFRRSAAASSRPWLALSGGGADGAFGAGVLTGWTARGTRPEFGVVTGVSTGAMMAPFAFAGPKYDPVLRETYTEITAADVFEFGGSKDALTDTWPLKKLVDLHVTPALLADIAVANRAGRRLIIVTTNVDTQRPVAWDMGAIAERGGDEALDLFRQIVMASSAIPGVFPPVLIPASANGKSFAEMHADGGTTSPFYLAPADTVLGAEGTFSGREAYLILNGRSQPDFEVTHRSTLDVLGRAMSAAIRAQTRATLALHTAFAKRTGLDLEVARIDESFDRRSPGPFNQDYMRDLFAFGEAAGKSGRAFTPMGADRAEPLATSSTHQARRADMR